MTRQLSRQAAIALILAAFGGVPVAGAQYFGRNKVQYEKFDWRIMKTDHFDLYFYPAESLKVHDAGRLEERWYARLSDIFRHQFDRKSVILYADHPDFQQTNVIGEQPQEGTGGVTEGMRTRVVLPFTGVNRDDDHVIGHEQVHVFQYNIAETAPGQGGLARLSALPLWLIEGMAEYFSLGRNDALTAMWMRDAVMRNKFPTIKQLTTDPRFFPYRYGQALWAYVGGRWGDRAVVDVYRTALRVGWDQALVRALGLSSDSLAKDWAAANKAFYAGQIVGRTHPDSAGRRVVRVGKEPSEYNLGPAQSPDGRYVAFFTTKTNLFGIDLVLADAATGKIIRRLAAPQSDGHFDAISFINSSGDWSPDGERFAFIVYNDGDNEIQILRTKDGKIEQRFHMDDIGAVHNVAWSPDGTQLVFSGGKGGISDLFLLNLQSRAIHQLTNDKYSDIQPTFSPDGRTIAFATDRGRGTSFEQLTFGELQIATIDLASGVVTVQQAFSQGKHINPQFSSDGRSLYFVSDQDGISDIYRMDRASNQLFRITHLATGVSGITAISPAISVAQRTGTLMFTVFKAQGHEIIGLEPSQLVGEPVTPAAPGQIASAATLPPGDVAGSMSVAAYLQDPLTGLVSGSEFRTIRYHSSFGLDALGQPGLGVASGPYGTGVAGGVSALWGDQLGDQMIYSAVQANGTLRDFGGAVYYQNLKKRLNWLAGIEHIPYLTGFQYAAPRGGTCQADVCWYRVLQRTFIDNASVSAAYPFSSTRRFELGVSGTRLAFEQQLDSAATDATGRVLFGQGTRLQDGPPALYYAQASAAFVGDNSFGGFTSPIAGMRYRFEAAPTVGTVIFNTALADVRRYFFKRPLTLAFRGLHYGRYGRDAENYDRLSPLYLGEETLMRGYGYGSFTSDECTDALDPTGTRCPVFERMLGSRVAVFNAELRIPVFGTSGFGLINFPYLPLEVSPFFDAGMAWAANQSPDFRFANSAGAAGCSTSDVTQQGFMRPCADRIPVFSTGVSFRANVLGYMILETYIAHPFQRPNKDWVVGIQLAPGW